MTMRGLKHTEETKRKMSEAGKGRPGVPCTSETKKKLSALRRGKKATDETKRKMSESMRGHETSQETRQKISGAHTGRIHTKESRRHMSEAHKGLKLPEEQKLKISASLKKQAKRQFCKYGHDVFIVGKTKAGGCRYCYVQHNATRRGVLFNLTQEEFAAVGNVCVYSCTECNETGMDRIDNTRGYVIGNVLPMCGHHNKMKNVHTIFKFMILCYAVAWKSLKSCLGDTFLTSPIT